MCHNDPDSPIHTFVEVPTDPEMMPRVISIDPTKGLEVSISVDGGDTFTSMHAEPVGHPRLTGPAPSAIFRLPDDAEESKLFINLNTAMLDGNQFVRESSLV